jgi:TRAP-type C4-dicarboxylate transport system permease small subunit
LEVSVQGLSLGTCALLVVAGWLLAFVVRDDSTTISASAVGAMLMVVGFGGALISLALMASANWLAEDWQERDPASREEE